jgi:hypothetical protein
LAVALSGGRAHDSPEGEKLLTGRTAAKSGMPIAMDRAYKSDAIREKAVNAGLCPLFRPKETEKSLGGVR